MIRGTTLVFLLIFLSAHGSDITGPVPASLPVIQKQVAGSLYRELPDLQACHPGRLKPETQTALIQEVNTVRALHGLPPVRYDETLEQHTRMAALLVAANRVMNHTPPRDFKCWTREGRIGSWNSNLYFHLYSAWAPSFTKRNRERRLREIRERMKRNIPDIHSIVATWMIDWRVSSVGHRRWLLDPFVDRVAFARVDHVERTGERVDHVVGAAINVIEGRVETLYDTKPMFIAYPVGHYPSDMFQSDWYLSFSLLVTGKSSALNEMVHFDGASVEMTDSEGTSLFVYDQKSNNDGYGLPNIFMWKAEDIQPETEYRVRIRNVRIGGIPRSYSYSFTLTNP